MKSNTYFKDSALAALKGNWGQAVAATLVYFLIACAVAGPGFYMYVSLAGLSDPDEILEAVTPFFTYSSGSLLLEVFLLFPVVIAYLNSFRRLHMDGDNQLVKNTLDFCNYWNKVGAMVLMFILIFLWSLLFFIPGIIKSFSYAMTPYILDEDPELSPSEAIHRSRLMMKGHKFDLFWLWLSFIGWGILNIFTCGIGSLWLNPYIYTATAAFYQEVKADYQMNGGLD